MKLQETSHSPHYAQSAADSWVGVQLMKIEPDLGILISQMKYQV